MAVVLMDCQIMMLSAAVLVLLGCQTMMSSAVVVEVVKGYFQTTIPSAVEVVVSVCFPKSLASVQQ